MTVRLEPNSLARVGVDMLEPSPFWEPRVGYRGILISQVVLRCRTCGATWKPGTYDWDNSRMVRGWWKCPNDPGHTKEAV